MIRGIILYVIANLGGFILGIPGLIAGLIHKDRANYLVDVAISKDQTANVVLRVLLNATMLLKNGKESEIKFGNPDHTISYVIGKNHVAEQLSIFGLFIRWFLDTIDVAAKKDGGHCAVAVKAEEDDK